MEVQSPVRKKPSRKKQWLWFVGLYILSVAAVGLFAVLAKLLIPH